MGDAMSRDEFDISVILATYTEERWQHLVNAVQSLREQTFQVCEIIVVVDGNPHLLERIRRTIPGVAIRTSFIVGFPGETEADYKELEAFITAANIDWLGVFTYSDEEGAKAFELADDLKVPTRTIQARRRKLMKLQQKISTKSKSEWVGREIDLIVEGESEETELLWEGRTPLHAPEIDGKVFINDFGPHEALVPGTFYRAEITESHDYDVVARIIE